MRALLVEDNMFCAAELAKFLKKNGFTCDTCYCGSKGFDLITTYEYDIILADLQLPDISGNDLIQQVRVSNKNNKKNIPIIVVSACYEMDKKVQSFLNGADDYIIKPYDKQELLMRIYSIIRRSKGYSHNIIKVGNEIELNLHAKTIEVNGSKIDLTATEFALLEFMIINKGTTLTKEAIIEYLYANSLDDTPTYKIIDVLVCKIRYKIAKFTKNKYVHTMWGMGYCVNDSHLQSNAEITQEEDIHVILD
jgi:two-component system cell cycle response regulator CtrA